MMRLNIIGFGNQAKSWALNLKDSGINCSISLRVNSPNKNKVLEKELNFIELGCPTFYNFTHYALLIPDEDHLNFLNEHANKFSIGTSIIYAHGYSVIKNQFEKSFPHLNHLLLAPKCIGSELRNQFLKKGEIGGVYSSEFCTKEKIPEEEKNLHILAKALGLNLGPFKTTFRNEVKADLFSEQGILCSLIPYTAELMMRKLVEKGVEPELAYLECWHELKLIISAMIEYGPKNFFKLISPNALIGSEIGKNKLLDKHFENNLDHLLNEIENDHFFQVIDQLDVKELRGKIENFWNQTTLNHIDSQIRNKN